MTNFFEHLPYDQATQLESLSRLAFELRENRKLILQKHGVSEETELHERIVSGSTEEHDGYEDYLGAKILAQARETVREELKACMEKL
jgi:hypothetical protein